MSKQKIEVGQVWKDSGGTYEVIKTYERNGVKMVGFFEPEDQLVSSMPVSSFIDDDTVLIQNADGTPVKQWRNVTPYELMRMLGEAKASIPCRVCSVDIPWRYMKIHHVYPCTQTPFRSVSGVGWKHCQIEVK